MINFYELLGLNKNANEREIKIAYREMVKKYHPDINKSAEANQMTIRLNDAKEILLNRDKRKEYDLLLEEIEHSKQVSKNKDKSYTAKKQKYKEKYSENYVTRWQFFMNYLKNGIDKIWVKIIKIILVTINYLAFAIIRALIFLLLTLLILLGELVEYISGLIMILSFIVIFALKDDVSPDYLPFIPANIEMFLALISSAVMLMMGRILFIKNSINIYVSVRNVEDKILVKTLMK